MLSFALLIALFSVILYSIFLIIKDKKLEKKNKGLIRELNSALVQNSDTLVKFKREMEEFILTDEYLHKMLSTIKRRKACYVGGSLSIELNIINDSLIVNLDGTYGYFSKTNRKYMNNENLTLLFRIYKENKGESEYYKEKLAKAVEIGKIIH